MPAVADLPPRPLVAIVRSMPDAQGPDGQELSQVAERATMHWEDRVEQLLSSLNGADDDALEYDSVPLASAGSVLVRYEFIGELQPLPYDLDD